jgi:hypothetical protein
VVVASLPCAACGCGRGGEGLLWFWWRSGVAACGRRGRGRARSRSCAWPMAGAAIRLAVWARRGVGWGRARRGAALRLAIRDGPGPGTAACAGWPVALPCRVHRLIGTCVT